MYLGLDCGTSGLKALLTDERGAPIASAARSYAPDRPKPNWSEQDPEVWRAAMAGAVADLSDSAGKALGAVKAIGFSGQMHGAVTLDRQKPPGPPGDPAQRRTGLRRGGRARPRLSASAGDRRGEADARLHRPEAALAFSPRARNPQPDRLRAGTERLSASRAVRRTRRGHERCGRKLDARRSGADVVGRSHRGLRRGPGMGAAAFRRIGRGGQDPPFGGRRTRAAEKAPSSPPAGAMRRLARSGSAPSPRAKPSFHLAPRRSSSSRPTAI